MEPALSMQTVAILAAIPVAAFALWADYFCRSVEARKEGSGTEQEKEVDRIGAGFRARSVGFLVLIAELSLFLGTAETRHDHPVLGNLVFIIAVLFQAAVQAGIDRKIGTSPGHPRQHFGTAAKAILWGLGAALSYAIILLFSVKAAVLAAAFLQTGTAGTAVLVVGGAIFGLVAGLALNFALGPIYLSKAFLPVSAPTEELRARVRERFKSAGMREPGCHIIEAGRIQGGTAFIAGFQWGRGPFGPALFISQSLLDALTEAELDAVLHHEIGHLKLSHLPKRLGLASVLIGSTFLVGTIVTLFLPVLIPAMREGSGSGLLAPMLALGSFLTAFRLIGAQSRVQEYKADAYAIIILGSRVADLCSALRKIDRMNGTAEKAEGTNHPATESRIQALSAYGPTEQETAQKAA